MTTHNKYHSLNHTENSLSLKRTEEYIRQNLSKEIRNNRLILNDCDLEELKSYYEIYKEKTHDLTQKNKKILENQKKISELYVISILDRNIKKLINNKNIIALRLEVADLKTIYELLESEE
ncbi:hypothetical protein K9L97_06100 [Candidatus Woesearchaeota archaeon]|nr:hypothetical protein [Candidatus Woesearchaeota archaeon]